MTDPEPVAGKTVIEVLGIDIGGTGIKAAPVNIRTGAFLAESVTRRTPDHATVEDLTGSIKALLDRFCWSRPVGIGYPGVVKDGVALSAAHLSPECLGANLQAAFQQLTSATVRVINDADAAGLAEMSAGAGRDYNRPGGGTVLMLTFGTGVGSAFFTDGHLLRNTEFGHMYVDGHEAEHMASARARKRENLTWQEWAARVNRFLAEMEKLTSPDLIIFGGGVTENFDKFAHLLRTRAVLRPASLQNDAGILGAALAVRLG